MAEYQKIEYRIGKDGRIVETVIGGAGPDCTQTTADFEAALGKVEKRELLPEYDDEGEANLIPESVRQSIGERLDV